MEKRKGYKTTEQQKAANERYYKNEDAREKRKIRNYKSNAKTFIKNYATLEDLTELENLIQEKKREI